jgi:triosephosphate isomerase (TIM)
MISKPFKVFGNLKMHAVGAVLADYAKIVGDTPLGLLVPYPYLSQAREMFAQTNVTIGAQSVSAYEKGAYSSQVSVAMLKDLGISCVMIGHSEVRALGVDVKSQLELAYQEGLEIIYCVGEDLKAYDAGERDGVLAKQLAALDGIKGVTIAYEPIWSIGTGQVASPEDIRDAVTMIKKWVGGNIAGNEDEIQVLYGGSINNNNCFEVYALENVDGFLIGGVSLKPELMLEVIQRCR